MRLTRRFRAGGSGTSVPPAEAPSPGPAEPWEEGGRAAGGERGDSAAPEARRRARLAVVALVAGLSAVVSFAVVAGAMLLRGSPPPRGPGTGVVTAPADLPSPRSGEAIAAGPGSQVAVLFGGAAPGGGLLDDTWVFDGHAWSQRHPGSAPPARTGAAVTYDAARHVVLLSGGRGGDGPLRDTWTWDGVGWTEQLPERAPPLGPGSAMAADAAARSVVLVTRPTTGSGGPVQTWLWDGRDWSPRPEATEPALAGPPLLSSDPVSGHVLLVSGAGAGGSAAATWGWNGRTWLPRGEGPTPAVRPGAGWMAADLAAGRVVLLETRAVAGGVTWVWDGARWNFVFPAAAPPIGAEGTAAGMVTDPLSGWPLLVGAGAPRDPDRLRHGWWWHAAGWRPA
jgi:hypothetical protein